MESTMLNEARVSDAVLELADDDDEQEVAVHSESATAALEGKVDTGRPFKDVKREIVDAFERLYLIHLLDQHRCNLAAAERSSGLSRRHLRSLMRKHGLYERIVRERIASLLEELP
jgi:DNA-binding NtrC family response regulator